MRWTQKLTDAVLHIEIALCDRTFWVVNDVPRGPAQKSALQLYIYNDCT